MDAGEGSTNSAAPSASTAHPRFPLQEQHPSLQRKRSKENVSLPTYPIGSVYSKSVGYGHGLCTFHANRRKKREREPLWCCSPAKEAYREQLAKALNLNRTRILAFKNPPPQRLDMIHQALSASSSVRQTKPTKPRRCIPQTSERTLDAPGVVDDFYLNLVDWGSNNVVAIALQSTIYLWDVTNGSISELVTVDDEMGPVTSVSWAPDGRHIAIGLNNSHVQLWDSDSDSKLQLRTLKGGHRSRVGSLAWNNHILTTAGMDGRIINNDVRIRSHIVDIYSGHTQEVCGLKWSPSGQQLASGGNDNLVHIWD
ncbi:hypothetical protein Tsubulata_035975 [Turnera subulata]|uniref:CDC20/Fizzy WD40 domain-containing protein n=1 Tax=Turnera subulata TaxID=218843 RepID=A0A9Q0EZ80_9ROSI|nr:hypothetical protein Tsubulata_035975 [Turnera subulata]